MDQKLPHVTIYTDGGCRPNPGPGAWAAVILSEGEEPSELVRREEETTNNRMELRAAIEALASLTGPHRVDLFTDSQYVRRGITEWLKGWQARGWRTKSGGEVKNQDLWRRLAMELERHEVSWHWVKGHAGERWNERVDELASEAIGREPLPVVDPDAVHAVLAVAASTRKGVGAWAVLLVHGDRQRTLVGRVAGAPSNRLHILGAVKALEALKRRVRVHLYTVSDYLKDGATTWIGGWKRRGWVTRDGSPVAHRDLWQELDRIARGHDVQWHVLAKDADFAWMDEAKHSAREALAKG